MICSIGLLGDEARRDLMSLYNFGIQLGRCSLRTEWSGCGCNDGLGG